MHCLLAVAIQSESKLSFFLSKLWLLKILIRSVDNPNNNAIHSPFGSNLPQTNPTIPTIVPVINTTSASIPPLAPTAANYDAESAGATTESSNTSSSSEQPVVQNPTPPQPPMPLTGPPGNVKNLPPINFRYNFLHHVEGDNGLFGGFRREPEELMRTIEAASRAADMR